MMARFIFMLTLVLSNASAFANERIMVGGNSNLYAETADVIVQTSGEAEQLLAIGSAVAANGSISIGGNLDSRAEIGQAVFANAKAGRQLIAIGSVVNGY